MRFQKVLTEEKEANLLQLLIKNCEPFLKELRLCGKFLWRGHWNIQSNWREVKPRKDRRPMDTPIEIQEEIDDAFQKKFRWRPRGEGVFTAFSMMKADEYGYPQLVFPQGKYKYVWSPKIEDFFAEIEEEFLAYQDDPWEWEQEWEHKFGEGSEDGGTWYYEGTDTGEYDKEAAFEAAMEAEGIGTDDPEYSDLFHRLEWVPEIEFDAFIEQKKEESEEQRISNFNRLIDSYKNKGLTTAAKQFPKHEVMLGCKKYYIVSKKYEPHLDEIIFQTSLKQFSKLLRGEDPRQLDLPLTFK